MTGKLWNCSWIYSSFGIRSTRAVKFLLKFASSFDSTVSASCYRPFYYWSGVFCHCLLFVMSSSLSNYFFNNFLSSHASLCAYLIASSKFSFVVVGRLRFQCYFMGSEVLFENSNVFVGISFQSPAVSSGLMTRLLIRFTSSLLLISVCYLDRIS